MGLDLRDMPHQGHLLFQLPGLDQSLDFVEQAAFAQHGQMRRPANRPHRLQRQHRIFLRLQPADP